ncbi:hypothetical protein RQP46_008053 [Phenoliferia psychrophenolica]
MTPAAAAAAAAALARESATSTPLPQITAVPLGIVPIRSRNHDDPISSPSPTTTHPPIPSNLPSPTIPDSLESAPHAAGSLDDVVLHSHETPSPSLLLNITPPPDTKSAYIVIPPTPVAPTSPAFVIPSLPPEFNNKGSFEHEEGPNYREDEKPLPSLPQPPKLDLDWSLPDLGFGLDFDESTSSPAEASESAKLLGNLGFEDPTKSFLRPTDDGQLPFPSRSTSPSFRLSFDGGKRDGWEEEEPQSAGPNLDEAFDVMTAFAMRFRQEDQPGWIPPPADPSHEERMGRWLEKQGVTPVLAGALASQSHMSDDDDDDANSNDADTGVDSLLLLHILKLSNEGEGAQERQRSRLAFGLISRACFLATADATEFCVEGVAQARDFIARIEQEKKWAVQEERRMRSGSTSRSAITGVTRVSNIRRLTLVVVDYINQKAYFDLLCATRDLVALELVAGAFSSQLAVALGEVVGLQILQIRASYLDGRVFLQSLISLKALEVLDLEVQNYSRYGLDQTSFESLALPCLKTLRIQIEGVNDLSNTILAIVAAQSTTGIQPIDHTLFDTLATLPSLQSVKLTVKLGELRSEQVIAYLDVHKSLRSLSIQFSRDTWTREQRDAVEEAADQAGVSFSSVVIE